MRILIVDDEAAARDRLALMLEDLDEEVVGAARHGLHALELAARRSPDVILLDINMPEIDGFEVAQRLPEPKPLIVFQTAFDEFALKAFEHAAVDYLVKPVTMERLKTALDRVRNRLRESRPPWLTSQLIREIRSAWPVQVPTVRPRVLVRSRGGHQLLAIAEVVLFRSKDGIVFAESSDGDYVTDYTLAELEGRTGDLFLRPNRAQLVNIDFIRGISGNGDGSATLTMTTGIEIHVTRRRAASVRDRLAG